MSYSIHSVTPSTVYLIDNDDGKTVTNMAEEVVSQINRSYPGLRIIYFDTDGYWNELVHENGEFKGWRNAQAPSR